MFLPLRLLKLELKRSDCVKQYLQYVNSLDKLDKCCLRIKFLEECRNFDIIPKFLNFRIPNNGCFDQKSIHMFQRNLLHKEIIKAKNQFSICEIRLSEKTSCLDPYVA